MFQEPGHLSDEQLLLVLDGENSRSSARSAQDHLASCWACRSRMAQLEGTIEEFVTYHQQELATELSDPKGPAALLRARMAEAAAQPLHAPSLFSRLPLLGRTLALAGSALGVAALALFVLRHPQTASSAPQASANRTIPDHVLTPGATRPVSLQEVCSLRHEEVVRDVPASLRQKVFREYGIANPRAGDYEVDYLIAPGLGGTDDIRNLWPQPAQAAEWNAHRKDDLEERLHAMVCDGQIDLETARLAIATNWIAAYEKYYRPDTNAQIALQRRKDRPHLVGLRRAEKSSPA
jgi:hypothetical protein